MTNRPEATSTVDGDVDITTLIDFGLIEMIWIDEGLAYRLAIALMKSTKELNDLGG